MPKRRNMCPNTHCPDYGAETGLMGGCVCGSALVPFKTADEQLNDTLNEIFTESHKRLRTYFLLGTMDQERHDGR